MEAPTEPNVDVFAAGAPKENEVEAVLTLLGCAGPNVKEDPACGAGVLLVADAVLPPKLRGVAEVEGAVVPKLKEEAAAMEAAVDEVDAKLLVLEEDMLAGVVDEPDFADAAGCES